MGQAAFTLTYCEFTAYGKEGQTLSGPSGTLWTVNAKRERARLRVGVL